MKYFSKALTALILIALFFPPLISAKTPTAEPSMEATPTAISMTDDAPYHGILPDHPLYKLQIFWDRVTLLFTKNPLQKTEKYLSFATRELEAAEEILYKGNEPLALHTALRGEHYITLLVDNTKSAAYGGEVDSKIFELTHAVYPAHQALLQRMIAKTTGETQNTLRSVLEFSSRNDIELTRLEAEIMEATPPSTLQ